MNYHPKAKYIMKVLGIVLILSLTVAFYPYVFTVPEAEKINHRELIKELLLVTYDETDNTGWGIRVIDMEGRKKHFSNTGWGNYQEYVRAQKNILAVEQRVIGKIDLSSMNFERILDRVRVNAEGEFCKGMFDSYHCGKGDFKISVTFTKGLIDKWEISPLPEQLYGEERSFEKCIKHYKASVNYLMKSMYMLKPKGMDIAHIGPFLDLTLLKWADWRFKPEKH